MKKYLLLLFVVSIGYECNAQNNYTVESTYRSLSTEEMMMGARANASRFGKYQNKAYECLNKKDYRGFIYYSDFALKTGYYNAKMYYNRGVSYEALHDYAKAKKEYKKAIKKGYYEAQAALENLKIKQKYSK